MPAEALRAAIKQVAQGSSLDKVQAAGAFDEIMRGEGSSAQIAALLVGLRVKGETADEIAGAAEALRGAMVRVPSSDADALVDTCGTGGGAVGTFNISTAAALLAAGAGVRVAKHGNRSFTSRCGSADVLEALGVPIEAPVALASAVLERAGIVFMYAPLMHPAMRHVAPVRRELGIATIMNVVGPLANPAGAGRQVIGVADPSRLPLLADALAKLGSVHALVVHGEPGMDEVSPLGPTHVLEVRNGDVRGWTIDPAALGYSGLDADGLAGGGPDDNARIVTTVLGGAGEGAAAARAAVELNAAAAMYVSGGWSDYSLALEAAQRALRAGAGAVALARLRSAYAAGNGD